MSDEKMEVKVLKIGGRKFLDLGGRVTVPIDRIKHFDFDVPNGGASGHSVKIVTDDPDDDFIFAFGNCDAIREFLTEHQLP